MEQKEEIKYFIYARKSSEGDEKQVQSIGDQVATMKEVAKDFKLNVVDTITESKSAKEPNARPEFEKMVERIRQGEANGILAWKIDRLSRNPIDSATVQWMLQEETLLSIQTVGREYQPEDNAIIFSVESGMANQYIRDLSRNVKRGLKSRLEKGWMPGSAPLGYLNTKTEERGKNYIVKDLERFPLIRKAWDLMLTSNYTPPAILDKLNNEWGFRTRPTKKKGGKPMSRSTIYRIFTNPFYMGTFEYKGQLYEGKHESMITPEEFDKVQILLGREGRPRPQRYKYAYTGLITCGDCGGPLSATTRQKMLSTGELKTYTLYYCVSARKGRTTCSQGLYTNADLIEKQIDKEIEQITILPLFKDWAVEVLAEQNDGEIEERTKIYEMQQKTLNDTQKQLDNLTKLRIKEMVDDEEYLREKSRLKGEIAQIKQKMVHTENRAESWLKTTEKVFEFACRAREKFADGDVEAKKEIFSALGVNWHLKDHELEIELEDWFIPIKEQYPAIEAKMKAFELGGNVSTARQKAAFAALRPQVRTRPDLNRRSSP